MKNKQHNRVKYFILLVVSATLMIGCSTKKNTFMRRAYHNLVAHYNGYFNAREILKEENEKLISMHKDDYSQLLPIFIYPTEDQNKALIPQMDIVIEKSSTVIERHSIYKRKKEHIKWIDDSYYLIGQAEFNKGNLVSAEQTFLYIYQGFKTEPIRYDAMLWLIRTHIEKGEWDKVETYFEVIEKDVSFPDEKLGLFNAIYADYHIKKDEDYENAMLRLEDAIRFTEERENKRRYTYILAQIYQKKGFLKRANELYADVLELRPDYIMAFNSKINRAIAYDSESSNSENIKKVLYKMLKDRKNEEFYDQVYFALAELALTEKEEALAIDYLKKSTKVSTVNIKQKALSFYKLADVYFAQPDYINAQAYYDSTTIYLPKDHSDYYIADEKNISLQELVKNLKMVELQDSLMKISGLSEKEQKRLVNDLINDYKREKERERILKEAAALAKADEAMSDAAALPGNSRGWYFYNPTSMAFGLSEFKRLWGARPLEDNWRRSNKQSVIPDISEVVADGVVDEGGTIAAGELIEDPNLSEETYLKNIPQTFNDKLIANGKIAEALYSIGFIFKESFEDYPSAIKAFERITKDFDTSSKALPAHYQLYRIYLYQDDKEYAKVHRDWVLENHPFSEYAYIIKDPNYNKQTRATKEKVESFYAATYRLYEYGLYGDVISSCLKADSVFNSDHLEEKFDFLKAKAIGHIRPIGEFKVALQDVIKAYPDDPVKEQAQQILDYINSNSSAEPKQAKNTNYTYEEEENHIVLIKVDQLNNQNDRIKNLVVNFNSSYFRNRTFDVSKILVGSNQSMLMIRTFDNKIDAMNYYTILQKQSNLEPTVKDGVSLITNKNLRTLFKEKDLDSYEAFFKSTYF